MAITIVGLVLSPLQGHADSYAACHTTCNARHPNNPSAMYENCLQDCYGSMNTVDLPEVGPLPPSRPSDLGSQNTRTNGTGNNQNQNRNQNQGGNQNQQQANQCVQQFEALLSQCNSQVDETSYQCDEKNDSGMTGVADTASQIALLMGQQTAASVQAACGKMGDLSQAAQGAVAAYRLNCSNSIKTCRETCDAPKNYVNSNATCFNGGAGAANNGVYALSRAQSARDRCNNFDSKVQQAQQAIQNYGATAANASQCEEQTKGEATPPPDVCKQNPQIAGCTPAGPIDCSKPEMATNKVCVCSKTPTDPMCTNLGKASDVMVGGGSFDPASRLNSGSSDDFGGDIPDTPAISHGKLPSGGPGEAVDGKQGAGADLATNPGSGSSLAGAGGGRSGAGGGAADNATGGGSGFYGGGSGGGVFGGGGGGARGAAGSYGKVGANGKAPGADLRQFLPGGKFDPRRGVAGVSGPDGITGPHSNIWQKIQNRYQVVSPSLIP
ncbi:hypothetical protein [Bdellovibrio bacteriovorus]|uniref:hypothetical protein n=1 Tax=Bdellovibrio bacteriovorus TaxID=959 RepID=UPI0035A603D9